MGDVCVQVAKVAKDCCFSLATSLSWGLEKLRTRWMVTASSCAREWTDELTNPARLLSGEMLVGVLTQHSRHCVSLGDRTPQTGWSRT